MKTLYKVCGTHRLGAKVRIFLTFNSLVEEKVPGGLLDMVNMFKDGSLQEELQTKAVLAQSPDVITIPYEEWKKYEYKVDDLIWIEVLNDNDDEK